MYEHVKTKERGWVQWYQGMVSRTLSLSFCFTFGWVLSGF